VNAGRIVIGGAALAALVAAAAPELKLYEAGLDLEKGESAVLYAGRRPGDVSRPAILAEARDRLESARDLLPDDPRPSYLLGSAALLANEPAEAILRYRDSLRIEERPETDVNLSRAHRLAGDPEAAAADALRAVWLSPWLLHDLPAEARKPLRRVIAGLEAELSSGSADAIPKLAPSDAAARQDHR